MLSQTLKPKNFLQGSKNWGYEQKTEERVGCREQSRACKRGRNLANRTRSIEGRSSLQHAPPKRMQLLWKPARFACAVACPYGARARASACVTADTAAQVALPPKSQSETAHCPPHHGGALAPRKKISTMLVKKTPGPGKEHFHLGRPGRDPPPPSSCATCSVPENLDRKGPSGDGSAWRGVGSLDGRGGNADPAPFHGARSMPTRFAHPATQEFDLVR